jgi:hypothetical protein
MSYHAEMAPVPKDLLDGTWGRAVKIKVVRYATPDGDPIRVGSAKVRAFTIEGAYAKARRQAVLIAHHDKEKRAKVLRDTIERLHDSIGPPGDKHLTSG